VAARPKCVNPPDPCGRETVLNEAELWKAP
jgi:hypothetical protein